MAKYMKYRMRIVRGDYTIQMFKLMLEGDLPMDLRNFDKIQLAIKTNAGTLRFTNDSNDPENNLSAGIACFRLPTVATSRLPAGNWPMDVQVYFGTERVTPVKGTAIVVEDTNRS